MTDQEIMSWVRSCLHKKKLKEEWADDIIRRAKLEGNEMRKYYCFHCDGWHVTSKKKLTNDRKGNQ